MIVPRLLLYALGGLAGAVLGAGLGLHLVRNAEFPDWTVGLLAGLCVALFMGLAHVLTHLVQEEEAAPLPEPVPRPSDTFWGWLIPQGRSAQMGYPLTKQCTLIGRDVDNDIMINSTSISRTHAQLVRMDGAYLVLDLDSKNGTYVNGEKVVQKQLHDGDSITIGEVQFVLRLREPESKAESAAESTASHGEEGARS